MRANETATAGQRRGTALRLVVALCSICGFVSPCTAADVALPAPVSSALSENGAALRVVQLAWEKQPTQLVSLDALVKRIGEGPASAAILPLRVKRFAWQGGKFYGAPFS